MTIIGIPFGLQHFKFIPLVFASAGKKVVTKFTRRSIMNILFNIFGGFPLGIVYYVLGILCCITIILIPVGLQMFKIASFSFAPFGAEIVKEDEYSKYKDTNHDMDLLAIYIIANPNKIIDDTFSNNQAYVSEYIKKYDKESKKLCRTINTVLNIFVMIIAFLFLILLTIDDDFNIFLYGMLGTIVLLVIINNIINHLVYNLNMKNM